MYILFYFEEIAADLSHNKVNSVWCDEVWLSCNWTWVGQNGNEFS